MKKLRLVGMLLAFTAVLAPSLATAGLNGPSDAPRCTNNYCCPANGGACGIIKL